MPILEIMQNGMKAKILLPADEVRHLKKGDEFYFPTRMNEKEPVIFTRFYIGEICTPENS